MRDNPPATRDLSFGAEPVVEVVTVLATAFIIEFIRPAADLFFKILARLDCERFRRQDRRMPMLRGLMLFQFFGNLLLFGS
ncbi:MAG: hypothetical protein WB781_12605 [Candidatus Sulfotelmatobacter sp.]